jgi:hypothetical protein
MQAGGGTRHANQQAATGAARQMAGLGLTRRRDVIVLKCRQVLLEEHAMPTSKQRRRIEIREDIYQQLSAMARREGYPVSRLADKLLALALEEYAQAHQNGRYPFGQTLLNMAKALLRQADTRAQ